MFFLRQAQKPGLTAADAVQGAADGTIIVVDVREYGEVAGSGKAKGALHIPLMRLRDMADPRHPDCHPRLAQDAKIAVYCASGGRSYSAEKMLRQMGYQDVHNIGGLGHWVRAGGALDKA